MLTHCLVSGTLPQDGEAIQTALDKASHDGFSLASTATCAIDEGVYFTATLVRAEEREAPTRTIRMKG